MEEYDLFNKLSASVSNIAYCCNLNHCHSRLNRSKRKEEDASAAILILKDYVDVTVSINRYFRIGKKCDDPNKPLIKSCNT